MSNIMHKGGGGYMTITPRNLESDSNKTRVKAYNSSVAQTIPASSWTKVKLPQKQYDTLSEFNTSTYRFTATHSGHYQVEGSVCFAAAGTVSDHSYIGIQINGSIWHTITIILQATGYLANPIVTDLVYLNVGDFIELYAYSNNSKSINTVGYWDYLSISRIL